MSTTAARAVPYVPDRHLQDLDNQTDYQAFVIDRMGPGRRFQDIITVKASFDYAEGRCSATDEPTPLALTDAYWDEAHAEVSSLRDASDIELVKPGTDVLVFGSARNRDDAPVRQWQGMLRVRDGEHIRVQKTLAFHGPCRWQYGRLKGWRLSEPAPTAAVPLRYELAWGGHWRDAEGGAADPALRMHPGNPSGSGFLPPRGGDREDRAGPQIMLPGSWPRQANDPRITVAGLGPLARFWQPRAQYAGTYDDAWHARFHAADAAGQLPDYPADYDARFHQSAPPDQIATPHLRGHESIELPGLTADLDGSLFDLPGLGIEAHLTGRLPPRTERLALDTLRIDLDARQAHLTWRLVLPREAGVTNARLNVVPVRSPA